MAKIKTVSQLEAMTKEEIIADYASIFNVSQTVFNLICVISVFVFGFIFGFFICYSGLKA